ncbi:MAG: phosphate ABC transporter substrate-binding/OmpA family protein [Tabrizicola sp.]|jgi:phosphate transport system substrate-binding protein|nr:phosphate ABC transporter substrate-binding/OmpA family protein [Tabrizicola sp.]
MTTIGRSSARRALLGAALWASTALVPLSAQAEEVSLKSSDGTVNLVGEFVEFVDNTYVIRTALGELRVSAANVRCEGAACPSFEVATADVTFAGSDTVGLGVMPLLLSGFAANLEAEITTSATGVENQSLSTFVADQGFGDPMGAALVTSTVSGDAFKALLDKSAIFGMASRRITPDEARALKAANAGNMVSPEQEHIIAADSIMVIVHPENPVSSLTIEQVRNIYAGIIVNWSEVGGPDLPITVLDRSADSGTRRQFQQAVFGENSAPAVPNAVIQDDNAASSAAVTDDPSAIAYVGNAFQRGAKAVPLVNECGITMEPTDFAVKTEEYPLFRRLYLYNRADNMPPLAQEIVNFILSPASDEVIARSGFIDLGVARQPQPLDSVRGQLLLAPNPDAFESGVMREMLAAMVDFDRLSTTFRFSPGSSKLDERGQLDISRLATYLESQPAGTKVLFVGFTDDVGEFSANRKLSENRAAQMLDTLRAYAGDRLANIEFASTGFGEIAPSACNTSDNGRAINRRVEVWIQSGG